MPAVLTSSSELQQNGSDSVPVCLPSAMDGAMFLPALKRLCSAKNTVQLTPHAAETWTAALSIYQNQPQIVNRAIVMLAVSEDPFPDLGKLLSACEKLRRQAAGTMPQADGPIAFRNVAGLARAWGLEV